MKLTKVTSISEIKIGKTFFVGWKRKAEIEVIRKPANERASYRWYWNYVINLGICYKQT